MKTDSEKGIGRLQYIVCFLLTFAYRFAYILGPAQMRVTYDDIGIICGPATLAGCNWLGSMKYVKYYGQSFSVLLTPIFVLFKGNPTMIWYAIEMVYLITASIGSVLIFHLGKKYLRINNDWIYVFAASISSLAFLPNNDMSNEPALFLSSVLIILFLTKISDETNKLRIVLMQVLVALAMMFGYLANSRALLFWAVLPILWLWALWKYKKNRLGYWFVWIPGLVLSYYVSEKIKDYVIETLWGIDLSAGASIANADASLDFEKIVHMLSCKGGIKAFFMTVFGGFYVSAIQTYGIILLMFVLVAFFLFKKKRNCEEFQTEISCIFCFGCFMAGLLGVALTWGTGLWEALREDKIEYAFKGIYYYRYYGSFIAPGLFAAICYISEHLEKKGKKVLFFASITFMLCVTVFNLIYVFPWAVQYDASKEEVMYPYVFESISSDKLMLTSCFAIMAVCFALTILSLYKNQSRYMGVVMSLLIILPIIFASNPSPYKALFNDHCDTGFNLVRYMERIPEAEDLGDTLYLAGESKTVINYQYALMEYKISEDIPQKEDIIVFANNNDSLLDDSYEWIQLDSNESVYVKGKYSEIVKQFLQHRN